MTERGNRVVAANAGAKYAERLLATANGKAGKGQARAVRVLKELGVEWKPGKTALEGDDVYLAAKKMSDLTQFRFRPEDFPEFFSTPVGKIFFQYKNFAYNQARFLKRQIYNEAREGNYGRAMRNLAIVMTVYPLAGEAVIGIRNELLGRERKEDSALEHYLNDIAGAGSLGILGDIFSSTENPLFSSQFLLGPTGSDVAQLAAAVNQAATKGQTAGLTRWLKGRTPLFRLGGSDKPTRNTRRKRRTRSQ
jgi:hypothetical protein